MKQLCTICYKEIKGVKFIKHPSTDKLHRWKYICGDCYRGRVKELNPLTNRLKWS